MPTTQQCESVGLIRQLIEEPHRFEFFQAVRLFEQLLVAQGIARNAVLTDYLQFRNSRSQAFPASQIEALHVVISADHCCVTDEAELLAAFHRGELERICITPAFFGFLGTHGVLPSHYGEQIAAHRQSGDDDGVIAFFDIFSNRLVALFYQAWRKHRLEFPVKEQTDGLMPLLLSLSGSAAAPLPEPVAAYYAAAFSQRPVSAAMIERVLADYFQIPVTVQPNTGRWHYLDADQESRLGVANCQLDAGMVLGARLWRRDLTVTIRLGPLTKVRYSDFLDGGAGSLALRAMLSMFETPTLTYKIQLILRAEDVGEAMLSSAASLPAVRLGVDAFLLSWQERCARDDSYYLI